MALYRLYMMTCQMLSGMHDLDLGHSHLQAGASPKEVVHTYFNSRPRMMPFASIDPSLAIAFYCRSRGRVARLFEFSTSYLAGKIKCLI